MADPLPSPAPTPSTPPGRGQLILTALVGATLIGDSLRLYVLGRTAPMAHLVALPLLPFWIPVAVIFVSTLIAAGLAMTGRLPAQVARLPIMVLALALFIDLFMLPSVRSSMPAIDIALPVQTLAQDLRETVPPGPLPSTVEELLPHLAELGPPVMMSGGVRLERWALVVRKDCSSPLDSAPGVAPGTILYCLRADGMRAWITAVGPGEDTFGPVSVAHYNGLPLTVVVDASAPTPTPTEPSAPTPAAPKLPGP